MFIRRVPILLILFLSICFAGAALAQCEEGEIAIELPCDPDHEETCLSDETICVPDGRPAYAVLVSGYHQNYSFDMFHWYNFAKCLIKQDAYVHFAWWNNFLYPWMARPLHDLSSEPGLPELIHEDVLGFIPILLPDDPEDPEYIHKAIPANDFQFQADLEAFITQVRASNPHAAIIIVGHSMGGDAVARFGAATGHDIDLLAPIDPVGNRSCTPWDPAMPDVFQCQGLVQWTRFRATHEDWFILPDRRAFSSNVKYLYHRWQQEFVPPLDYLCPPGGNLLPCLSGYSYHDYTFRMDPDTPAGDINSGSTNVQSRVTTTMSLFIPFSGVDGHGEIVGFQGFNLLTMESNPLALRAQSWPAREDWETRISLMQSWDGDSDYLDDTDHAPTNPGLCMVSGDLCTIFETVVNLPPIADAGPDQTLECASHDGALVTLDGSGSSDPNDDPLTFTWVGPFGTVTGELVDVVVPLGTHTITLTVDDGRGKSDSDTVDITIVDTTPPELSFTLLPDFLWPPNHKMRTITTTVDVSDICDPNPSVELVSITSNEPGNGQGDGNTRNDIQDADFGTDDREFSLRAFFNDTATTEIYTVTYGAMDASGNATDATGEVTVAHDRGNGRDKTGNREKPGKRGKRSKKNR
jgi:pimeloyl-ACP methyl ester carboxylesterase